MPVSRRALASDVSVPVDRLPLACIAFDANLKVIEWNPAAERIFGFSRDEMIGCATALQRLTPPDALFHGEAIIDRLRAGDMAAHSVNRNLTKDGRTITCEWFNTPRLDDDGGFDGFVSLAQDVTARLQSETALRASEERFRQVADSIREVFWVTTSDTHRLEYLSPSFESIWGRSRAEAIEDPTVWPRSIHDEDRGRVLRAANEDQDRGHYDQEYRIVRPDGSVRWVRDRAFQVRDGSGAVVRIAGVAEDITERRHLESQLVQAQKMEAVGELAGGVAHDFNNLLTVVSGYGELLLASLPSGDPLREPIEEIVSAGERSSTLTRRLLAFSRKQALAPTNLDLNEVVRDTQKMLRHVLRKDVDLVARLAPSLPMVHVDHAQLEQALLNLAINAQDAMPEGGTLTITTLAVRADVVLEIRDTGVGMTEAVKRHVFEPFFTTKPAGKGTGLGLSVVHGFVMQSNGRIDVESEPGRGTTFRIALRGVEENRHAPASPAGRRAELARGRETILLVEDEDGVRALGRRVLERCGYRVLDARCGDDALRVAQEHAGPIHLLITDVIMPRGGGRLVAEQLLALRCDLKVLYVSGYSDEAIGHRGVRCERANFLAKPFTPQSLAEKVRELLSN
jgi:two-component system, cell cycle sensor histidine kinase and response regulator CckA